MSAYASSLRKLPTAVEMRQWDAVAIEFGIPETALMDSAAIEAAKCTCLMYGDFRGKLVCLFMGHGNNGGDAAALARHIIDKGGQAAIFSLAEAEAHKNAAAHHLKLALADGAKYVRLDSAELGTAAHICGYLAAGFGALPSLLVDGLLGTGFSGQLRLDIQQMIKLVNDLRTLLKIPAIALDIPSGLDSLSGKPAPVAVNADLTVTFAAPKPGLFMPGAKKWTGQVICRDINIPVILEGKCPARWRLLDGGAVASAPSLELDNSHKNFFGHVYVFGGLAGHSGAAHMAAIAALRAGAGLVTACAPKTCLAEIKCGQPEIMTRAAGDGWQWRNMTDAEMNALLSGASAIVVGPGMGTDQAATDFLACLLSCPDRPTAIIDADALRILAARPDILKHVKACDILTPHPGEAAALLGTTSRELQNNRMEALDRLCGLSRGAVVLKGACTLVGQRAEQRFLCPYDIAQLAIAGAGDVLAGCIGAIAASKQYQNLETAEKAALGVAMHAMAGLAAATLYPCRGALARDIADQLAHARKKATAQSPAIAGTLPWPA